MIANNGDYQFPAEVETNDRVDGGVTMLRCYHRVHSGAVIQLKGETQYMLVRVDITTLGNIIEALQSMHRKMTKREMCRMAKSQDRKISSRLGATP